MMLPIGKRPSWAALCLAVAMLPAPRAFQVETTTETISERGEMLRLLVSTEQGKFGFMPPPNWKWQHGSAERVVQLIDQTGRASLMIRFASASETAAEAAALEEWLGENFAGATVLDRFQGASRDGHGPGLEAAFAAGGGVRYRLRVARLAYAGQVAEIQMAGPVEMFEQLHSSWTYVLNSFGREGE